MGDDHEGWWSSDYATCMNESRNMSCTPYIPHGNALQSKTSTWDPLLSHGFVSLHPRDPTLLLKQLILEPLISPVNSWSTAFNSVGRACPSLVPLPLSTIVHGASQQNKVTWILSLTIDPIKFSVLSFTSFSPTQASCFSHQLGNIRSSSPTTIRSLWAHAKWSLCQGVQVVVLGVLNNCVAKMEKSVNYGDHDDLNLEATELRLGLPGISSSSDIGYEKQSSSASTVVVVRNNKRASPEGIMTQESSTKSNSSVSDARNVGPDSHHQPLAKWVNCLAKKLDWLYIQIMYSYWLYIYVCVGWCMMAGHK